MKKAFKMNKLILILARVGLFLYLYPSASSYPLVTICQKGFTYYK
ncbi:hypothetical protein DB42_CT00550 [Neochlamydia sp. EPS4]|nr:hypothetical protein DB42_CT00550 [Neochlamydia sp. EPS4]KIC76822.1 hypothetical protein DB41_EH00060 [Neochlamydia sp. TUME1]